MSSDTAQHNLVIYLRDLISGSQYSLVDGKDMGIYFPSFDTFAQLPNLTSSLLWPRDYLLYCHCELSTASGTSFGSNPGHEQ